MQAVVPLPAGFRGFGFGRALGFLLRRQLGRGEVVGVPGGVLLG
ncbi:hypothetical protein QF011_003443 [Curtobacterium flaccumfaciens]|nr:hypothetical protein [Curtobacterium flaccumfaciens]